MYYWMQVVTMSLICLLGGSTALSAEKKFSKDAIIMVAFGTSDAEARKVFTYIDKKVKARFPKNKIYWGFTAKSIVEKLRKEGTDNGVLTLDEALKKAHDDGYNEMVLQSLHVVAGQKHRELAKKTIYGARIIVGKPLMSGSEEDVEKVLLALDKDIVKGGINVIAGHGNDHHPEYNKELEQFNAALKKKYSDSWLCTVEGKPGTGALLEEVKPAIDSSGKKVNFIPLMIVAGDHIINDVTGPEEDSWKSILEVKDYTLAKPLGYNDAILDIYFQNIEAVLAILNRGCSCHHHAVGESH